MLGLCGFRDTGGLDACAPCPSRPALNTRLTAPPLQRLLPQLPHLRELRLTSGQAGLPAAVAAVLPRGCQFSTAGLPREGPAVDAWGRSLHQTAPLAMDWADSLLTTAGVHMPAVEADEQEAARQVSRQVSRVLVS